jgi:hypothetical protein
MCPACMTTAALIAAGASSASGLAVLLVKNLRGNADARLPVPTIQTEGERDESPANRITS